MAARCIATSGSDASRDGSDQRRHRRPEVELDLRTLYLNDLTLLGCTVLHDCVFENLVGRIERARSADHCCNIFFDQIVAAQKLFLTKQHVGKIVLAAATR